MTETDGTSSNAYMLCLSFVLVFVILYMD